MLFKRQKLLLALLDAAGGEVAAVDFQKLLFLFCTEQETEPSYEFVPHRFGCYSFTAIADRKKLMVQGWLEPCEKIWKLAKPAEKIASDLAIRLRLFAKRLEAVRGDALLAHTYTKYPATAWRSEVRDRVLDGNTDALRAIEKKRPKKGESGLVTIGYEGRSLEAYLNLLLNDGVSILCDVRRNPISRRFGFSKSTLRSSVEAVGLRYEHLPQLGIASEERQELLSQADYDSLFARYKAKDLPLQGAALTTIADWVESGERVALTCFEHLPHQCHRHCVADAVLKKIDCRMRHL